FRIDQIVFADQTIWDVEYIKNKLLIASDDNDVLQGYRADETLSGFNGRDIIYGNAGNDIIYGGEGNDQLNGGSGNDSYRFGLGDGQDIIYSYDSNNSKIDQIIFDAEIEAKDVSLKRQGNDLIIQYSEQDKITINSYFDENGETIFRIDQIVFADQTIWDVEYIKNKLLIASDDNDVLQGYRADETLSGFNGSDIIYGNSGNDIIYGGQGNDQLFGGLDNDFLIGGSGNDQLDGGAGNNSYFFSLGDGQDIIFNNDNYSDKIEKIIFDSGIDATNVTLKRLNNDLIIQYSEQDKITISYYFDENGETKLSIDQIIFADQTIWDIEYVKKQLLLSSEGNDTLRGYSADETLLGLAGDDHIYGNTGNDTIIGGSGNDTLYGGKGDDILIGGVDNDYLDGGEGSDSYLFSLGDGIDTIEKSFWDKDHNTDKIFFNEEIDAASVKLKRQNDDLIIQYSEQDQINVKYYFNSYNNTNYFINQIKFSDGTIWDESYIQSKIIIATMGDDIIKGYDSNDIISGLEGNDYLEGGLGNDTYVFGLNFGHDTIYNYSTSSNDLDTIQFIDGFTQADFIFRHIDNDLVIRTLDGENTVTIRGYFIEDLEDRFKIDQIKFSDNTILDIDAVKALVLQGTENADILKAYATGSLISGNVGNDIIYGDSGNDQLAGDAGDDQLYGGSGADILEGGNGNDTLVGGAGSDTYIFGLNFGHDIISNNDPTENRLDIIQFSYDFTQADFIFRRINTDLVIRTLDGENSITIQDYFLGEYLGDDRKHYKVDQIKFSDNTILDIDAVKALVLQGTADKDILIAYKTGSLILGNAGDDIIDGNWGSDQLYGGVGSDQLEGDRGNDLLDGGEGDDILSASGGDDILRGGEGNDYLKGGEGNDTYLFGLNFGNDIINNMDQTENRLDTIQFTDGFTQADFIFRRINTDLVIRTLDGENSITVQNYFEAEGSEYYQVNQIKFSDNKTLDIDAVNALVLLGTPDADILRAYSKGSLISGNEGNDIIYGNSGNDQLAGDAGEDQLYGGSGNDILKGGNGHDRLEGGDGNDTLVGDAGNDILIGGTGNNIYQFDLGWGVDLIQYEYKNKNDINIIEFNNIDPDDLIVRSFNNNMVIYHRITGDQLIIQSQFNTLVSDKPINLIRFDNSVEWNETDFNIQAIKGTDSDDFIQGVTISDVIHGGLGNDIIHGFNQLYGQNEISHKIYGEAGNDELYGDGFLDGGEGNDILNGSGILIGGSGNDELYGFGHLIGGDGNDFIQGNGILDGGAGEDEIILDHFEFDSYINGGDGADVLSSNDERMIFINNQDSIEEEDGYYLERNTTTPENERVIYFEGGRGDDTIYGTFGDDVYIFNLGDGQDNIVECRIGENYSNVALSYDIIRFGEGIFATDILFERISDDLKININNSDNIVVKNYFTGPNGHYKIEEIQFYDGMVFDQNYIENHISIYGTSLADTIWGTTGDDIIFADAGDDHIQAQAGNDHIFGEDGNDSIFGEDGDDYLDGGLGDDYLDGGLGKDTYVFAKGGGTDTYSFEDNIDAINTIKLEGYASSDVFAQKQGNSVYLSFKNSSDHIWLYNYNIADTAMTSYKVDQIIFDSGTTWTTADIDALVNRAATNHAPTVNAAIPTITANQGTNFSYKFANNVIVDQDSWDYLNYKITLTTKDSSGQYQALPSWLTFDSVTQTLTGTPPSSISGNLSFFYWGTDMYGYGTGTSFTLKINLPNHAPVVANSITDQNFTDAKAFSYTVASNAFTDADGDTLSYSATLEDGSTLPTWLSFNATTRTLSGTSPENSPALNIKITAKDTSNQTVSDVFKLSFTIQNLTINGTSSADTLYGGSGNDTITGQAGNDTLYGQSGNDTLNGGTGSDIMYGGKGDDTYIVDNTGDIVNENPNEGIDTVQSSVTYTLGNNVENLTLTGTSAINATGNALNNILIGNSAVNTLTGGAGDDYLNGGAGNDKLLGGTGNDTYIVDSTGDAITENANEGIDTVLSSVTFTLGNNLENLTLTGSAAINATGNTLNNILIGNSANNILSGGAGNDILDGMAGNDQFTGGTGSDTLIYQLLLNSDALGGNGSDTWSDFTVGNTTTNLNADKIDIGDLLVNYTGSYSAVSLEPFIKTVVSGNNTQLYIDRDGGDTLYNSTLLLTLNNVNTNLNDLINNQQIII
ncbi:calcium-binding protein, partial [Acinetobacter sp. ANC 3791]